MDKKNLFSVFQLINFSKFFIFFIYVFILNFFVKFLSIGNQNIVPFFVIAFVIAFIVHGIIGVFEFFISLKLFSLLLPIKIAVLKSILRVTLATLYYSILVSANRLDVF